MIELSIVIPVYNVAPYLPACLESVFGQTGFSFELILVDDASTDESSALCREYAQKDVRVKYIRHEQNKGLSCARNTGLKQAQGQYVTFIDSDDFIAPNTLTRNMQYLQQDSDIDVLEYPVQVYYGSSQTYLYQPMPLPTKQTYRQWVERKGYRHSYACNKIYRRSLWHGLFFPAGRFFEDLFVVPWVMKRASCILAVPDGLYYYCRRGTSITSIEDIKKRLDLFQATWALYCQFESDGCWDAAVLNPVYLHAMDRQIDLLRAGGRLQLPSHRSVVRMAWAPGVAWPSRFKALLGGVLGRNACRLYCFLYKILRP